MTYDEISNHFDNTIFMVTNQYSVLSFDGTQFTRQGDKVKLKCEKKGDIVLESNYN